MADVFLLNTELGPQFTVEIVHRTAQSMEDSGPFTLTLNQPAQQNLTLVVGAKSSSLFGSSGGSATGTLDVAVTAAQIIGAYKAVTYGGILCEPTNNALSQYAGITRVAVSPGDSLHVVRSGLITEGGWTWTPDAPVFVGASGKLTQVVPAVVRRIGWATSPTQISLDPFPIIGA